MPIEPLDLEPPSRAERLLYRYLCAEPDIHALSLRRAARASLHALRRVTVPPRPAPERGAGAMAPLIQKAPLTRSIVGEGRSHPERRRNVRFAPDRRRR